MSARKIIAAPGRDGAAVGCGGEPRHRHAGGVATGRGGARDHRPADAHRRAGRDRRHSRRRAELRRGGEPQAIIDQPSQFDFYDGGGRTSPSSASPRPTASNLNVSKFGPPARRRGRLHQHLAECQEGRLRRHLQRGRAGGGGGDGCPAHRPRGQRAKFVDAVEHRTFSGTQAAKWRRDVLTSPSAACSGCARTDSELIEIAPGSIYSATSSLAWTSYR